MARAKRPNRQHEIEALVVVRRQGSAVLSAGLWVNPGFAPPQEKDLARGVDYPDAPEIPQAERAVAARLLRELVPTSPGGIRLWIALQQRRYGRQGLEQQLLDMQPIPAGKDPKKFRLSLRRALERSGPPKKPAHVREEQHKVKGVVQPDYRRRFEMLALRQAQVVLLVYGHWWIREEAKRQDHDWYDWARTDPSFPEELEESRKIIANGGIGLVDYVVKAFKQHFLGQSGVLELETVYGIQVQFDQGGIRHD